MCPTHIWVHRTPPLRGGEFTVLGQGGYIVFWGVGVNILPYGYINPWSVSFHSAYSILRWGRLRSFKVVKAATIKSLHATSY